MTYSSDQLDSVDDPSEPVSVVEGSYGLRQHIYRALPEIDRTVAIVSRLRDSMSLGLLREGSRLPSEVEMADSFGVSPTTVREALSVLRSRGLVETRRGRNGGTFVVSMPASSADVMRDRLETMSVVDLRDLGDHRAAVATASIQLAASRTVDSDLQSLQRLVKAFETADDANALARADSRIWLEIAVSAQSRRLLASQLHLQLEVSELLWTQLGNPRSKVAVTPYFFDMVEALGRRDGDAAARAVSRRIQDDTFHMIDQKLTLALHEGSKDDHVR